MIPEELWRELETQSPPGVGIVRRRVRESSGRDIFIGVSYPHHERMLILSVAASVAAGVTTLPATRAIRSTIEELPDQGAAEIRVILKAPEMNAVFASFTDDVVDAIAQTPTDAAAVSVLASRFRHWQWLLAGQNPEGLSRVAAQGLYGELWSLSNVAFPALGPTAVDGWTGPDRDDIDFQYQEVAFEVKTTVADNPPTIRISSERQLNPVLFGRLYLVALSLEQLRGGSGESLNYQVDRIRAQLTGTIQAVSFADKLLQCGYLTVHKDRYEMPRYAMRELAVFRITADFPRISEDSLPLGVGRVSYDLALAACEKWKTTPEMLTSELQSAGTSFEH
jgi:Putative  PD-(D/E)XK family member, (DUF4420)